MWRGHSPAVSDKLELHVHVHVHVSIYVFSLYIQYIYMLFRMSDEVQTIQSNLVPFLHFINVSSQVTVDNTY